MKTFFIILMFGCCLIGFAQPGFLDSTFATNGIFTHTYSIGGQTGMVVENDNKIFIEGFSSNTGLTMISLTPGGSYDTGFNLNGVETETLSFEGRGLALQADGKFVLAGARFDLLRYNADGSLDNTFGVNGISTRSINASYDRISSMAIQSDGKIVLTGSTYNGNNWSLIVMRVNANGSPDNSFGSNGSFSVTLGVATFTNPPYNYTTLIQNDGKILINVDYYNFTSTVSHIMRLNSNGTMDMSFAGGNGMNDILTGSIKSIALQPDGKILAAGTATTNYNIVYRFNSNGFPDNTFGGGGYVSTFCGYSNCVFVQPDGKILAAGYTGSFGQVSLVRYNSDGSLDTGFGTNGIVFTDINSQGDFAYNIGLQSDGKIIVGGFSNAPGQSYYFVARYFSGLVMDVEKNELDHLFRVFPNPANEMLSVSGMEGAEFAVANVMGQVIKRGKIDSTEKVDVSRFSKGVYFLTLKYGVKIATVKIIKD